MAPFDFRAGDVAVGVVTTLLKQVPAAAKYKSKLLAMAHELAQLRAQNAALKDELAQYLEQWETLDGPQVATLQYLAQNAHGDAAAIAKQVMINVQIAHSSLAFLAQHRYVAGVAANGAAGKRGKGDKRARYKLAPKGERYLRGRGML